MLTLSRTPGESLTMINTRTGEKIVIANGYIKSGERCGIGIDAPEHYKIYRTEKLEEMLKLPPETPTEYESSIED